MKCYKITFCDMPGCRNPVRARKDKELHFCRKCRGDSKYKGNPRKYFTEKYPELARAKGAVS